MLNLNVTAKVRIQLANLKFKLPAWVTNPGVPAAHLDDHGPAPGGAQPEGLLASFCRSGSWLLAATVTWTASHGCRGRPLHDRARAVTCPTSGVF